MSWYQFLGRLLQNQSCVCDHPSCGGKVSLIAELCQHSPRDTRCCSQEEDDAPSTTERRALASVSAPMLPLVARRCSSGRPRCRSWKTTASESGSEDPSARLRMCRAAVCHAAAGGRPDPVEHTRSHGARLRDETASRRPHSVPHPCPRGAFTREEAARGSSPSVPHARPLGPPVGPATRCAAALSRQEAAWRVLQQWRSHTHPTLVATSTISSCEHTGVTCRRWSGWLTCRTIPGCQCQRSPAEDGPGAVASRRKGKRALQQTSHTCGLSRSRRSTRTQPESVAGKEMLYSCRCGPQVWSAGGG